MIIGTISKEALASHQVAITCAATVFMVPLGISMALTVRVGLSVGLFLLLFVAWSMGLIQPHGVHR